MHGQDLARTSAEVSSVFGLENGVNAFVLATDASTIDGFALMLSGTTLIQASQWGHIQAYDALSGTARWSQATVLGAHLLCPPVIAGGKVWASSDAGTLFALDLSDGHVIQSFALPGNVQGPLGSYPYGGDTMLSLPTADGRLILVLAQASLDQGSLSIYSQTSLGAPSYAPAGISAFQGQRYYLPDLGGQLFAQALQGSVFNPLFNVPIGLAGKPVRASAVALPQGLYVADDAGIIRKFEPDHGELLASVDAAGTVVGLAWDASASVLIALVNRSAGATWLFLDGNLALLKEETVASRIFAAGPVLSQDRAVGLLDGSATGALVSARADQSGHLQVDLPTLQSPAALALGSDALYVSAGNGALIRIGCLPGSPQGLRVEQLPGQDYEVRLSWGLPAIGPGPWTVRVSRSGPAPEGSTDLVVDADAFVAQTYIDLSFTVGGDYQYDVQLVDSLGRTGTAAQAELTVTAPSPDTWTPTPTASISSTPTGTPLDSPTRTVTPTCTDTPSVTESATSTESSTESPSFTESQTWTDTATPTITLTATPSSTLTITRSITKTRTLVVTDTDTETPSFTTSPTLTESSSDTATETPSVTATPTITQTPFIYQTPVCDGLSLSFQSLLPSAHPVLADEDLVPERILPVVASAGQDAGYYVLGDSVQGDFDEEYPVIMRVNGSDGQVAWSQAFTDVDYVDEMRVMPDGGIVLGTADDEGGRIERFNAAGDLLWETDLSSVFGSDYIEPEKIRLSPFDGSLWVFGQRDDGGANNTLNYWALPLNPSDGSPGTPFALVAPNMRVFDLAIRGDGTTLVFGFENGGASSLRLFSPTGSLLWSQAFPAYAAHLDVGGDQWLSVQNGTMERYQVHADGVTLEQSATDAAYPENVFDFSRDPMGNLWVIARPNGESTVQLIRVDPFTLLPRLLISLESPDWPEAVSFGSWPSVAVLTGHHDAPEDGYGPGTFQSYLFRDCQAALPTLTSTETLTATGTVSPTVTSSVTETITGTATFTATSSSTETASPSATPSATGTASPTETASATETGTGTSTATETGTVTVTASPTGTPSVTGTATETASPSTTPSVTETATATVTPTFTGTVTPSSSDTPSVTGTLTPTPSATPTVTQTPTPASGLFAEYRLDGSPDDASGACGLETVGTLGYVSSPQSPQGGQAAGPFTDANYLRAQNCLVTALRGQSEWGVTGYVYIQAFTIDPVIVEIRGEGSELYWIEVLNNGRLRVGHNGFYSDSATSLVSAGAWYHFGLHGSSSGLEASISPAASPDLVTDVVDAHDGAMASDLSTINLGRAQTSLGRNLNGYLDQVRFWVGEPSAWTPVPTPSATVTATPTSTVSPTWTPTPVLTPTPTATDCEACGARFSGGKGATVGWLKADQRLLAVPDPARDDIWLAWRQDRSGQAKITAFDLAGTRVRQWVFYDQKAGENRAEGDVRGLASGIYILVLEGPSLDGPAVLARSKLAVLH